MFQVRKSTEASSPIQQQHLKILKAFLDLPDAGAQLGLQFHYFTPDHKNSWQMDPSGRISRLGSIKRTAKRAGPSSVGQGGLNLNPYRC